MGNGNLNALLRTKSGADHTEAPAAETVAPVKEAMAAVGVLAAGDVVFQITGLEVEAVVGGALQRISFGPGTNPALVGEMLRTLDPAAKVRDAFPMKGMGGNRETKLARAFAINVKGGDSGVFWDIVVRSGDDDLTCGVSRKNSAEFPAKLAGLGKLSDRNLAKLDAAVSGKKSATVILSDDEQFGVKYWTSDDGRAYVDDVVAEAPAEVAPAGENGHE